MDTNKLRAKIKEPMSDADRAALEAKLDRIVEDYHEKQYDMQRWLAYEIADLEKDITKAVIAHAETQAQE